MFGDVNKPTALVKTTKDMTLGFISNISDFKKFPKFEFMTQFKINPTTHKQAKQITKKFNGSIVFIENRSFLTYVDKPSSPPYFVQPTEK